MVRTRSIPQPLPPAPSGGSAEAEVRARWRARGLADGPPAPAGDDAPGWVLHSPTAPSDPSWHLAVVALHTVIDVIVRHRAMDGVRVEAVTGGRARRGEHRPGPAPVDDAGGAATDDATTDGEPVGALLGCTTAARSTVDARDPDYADSVWWAITQLWEAGLLAEQRVAALGDDRDTAATTGAPDRDAPAADTGPAATASRRAIVRFPVASDGALRTAGASLLVTVDGPDVLLEAATIAVPTGADLVLAHAMGDDYPVVVDRAVLDHLLGADATILRAVGVDEVRGVRCRNPLDGTDVGGAEGTAEADAARARAVQVGVCDAADGPDTPPLLTTADDLAAEADGVGADDAGSARPDLPGDDVYAALARHGLLFRGLPPRRPDASAPTCATDATPGGDRWVIPTTRWRAQLQEQHAVVTRTRGPVPPWATGGEDWTVTTDDVGDVPLPLWRCATCEHITAVAGRSRLATLSDRDIASADPRDAAVTTAVVGCERCGDSAHRIPRWLDAGFVAGCLPFARFGFPAVDGSDARFARQWHADVVVSGRGTDADAALVIATLLWGARPHDTVLSPPAVDADTDAAGLWQRWGADALRWAIVAPGAVTGGGGWGERTRSAHEEIIAPLRDVCAMVVAAARAAGLPTADAVRAPAAPRDPWDRWLLAELAATVDDVRSQLDACAIDRAAGRIRDAVSALGTWRARRRAVADDHGMATPHRGAAIDDPADLADDDAALATLHEFLVTVAGLLAPFMPFLADEVYEALVRADDPATPDSIHLLRFPTADPSARDDGLRHRMRALGADADPTHGATPRGALPHSRWDQANEAPATLRPTGTR